MNVEEMTFGIEIETTIPRSLELRVGSHGYGAEIPQLPGWKADADPSIRARGDHRACEFVSPVFKGSEGLKQCLADVAKIREMGAKVNDSCGLHVHVGVDKANAEVMTKLVTLVSNFEKAIYASTGTKKRETGRWCNSLHRYGAADYAIRRSSSDRYHVCNLATGSKPTVEFRAFAATLNAVKITAHVMTCVGIVERAYKAQRKADWTAKVPAPTSPLHRSGEGQTAATRLFYQLGWTKGRTSHTYGDLKGDGVPTIKAVKKEVMRLARKYDAPPVARVPRGRLPVGTRVRLTFGNPLPEGVIVGYGRRGMAIVELAGPNGATSRYRVARRQFTVIAETPATGS